MLSEDQQLEFEQTGVARLTGVFSEANARHMSDQVWRLLAEQHGIHPTEPATWTICQPTGFQALTRSRAFEALASPVLADALDHLLGPGAWGKPKQWGAPLVTFPDPSLQWEVPSSLWHLDFPARGQPSPLPGVRILAFLAPVAPRGGGTLVLTGSHRLVERLVATEEVGQGHSIQVRQALSQRHPWLRNLWSKGRDEDRIQRFMIEGCTIEGAPVRVLELTGVPGDVFLMHPWTLHAPSPNGGTTPRMMLSHSVFRTVEG